MPIRSRKAESGLRTITVEYQGETASITFAPGRYDLGRTFELTAAVNDKDWRSAGAHIVAVLSDVLEAWDVLGEDDQPEPITPENLALIGAAQPDLLFTIWGAVRAEGNPPRASGAPSKTISLTEATSPPASGGISSSPPPNISELSPGNWTVATAAPSGANGR